MSKPGGGADLVVAVLPAEIDLTNAECVGDRLVKVAASVPGIGVVVADLSQTRFCDSAGVRQLLLAHRQAAAHGVDVRLAAPREPVLRVLELMGVDRMVRTYPSVYAAVVEGVTR
jgi:anti-anti-sigma factor